MRAGIKKLVEGLHVNIFYYGGVGGTDSFSALLGLIGKTVPFTIAKEFLPNFYRN